MSDYDFLLGEGLIFVLIGLAIGLVIAIFYLLSLQRALDAIDPMCRKMPPGQVWLLLIPLFNLVWQFIVVIRIADSFKAEFERLNVPVKENRPTFNIGIAKSILGLCGYLSQPVGAVASIASLICWVAYWIKVDEYRRLVIANRDNDLLDAERGIFHE